MVAGHKNSDIAAINQNIVLMAALIVLSLAGLLDAKEALAGFSNDGLITPRHVHRRSGHHGFRRVELLINKLPGNPETVRGALCHLVLPIIPIGAFVNNTPVIATMIPAVANWSKRIDVSPSMLKSR